MHSSPFSQKKVLFCNAQCLANRDSSLTVDHCFEDSLDKQEHLQIAKGFDPCQIVIACRFG